jgi:hypothetical protein
MSRLACIQDRMLFCLHVSCGSPQDPLRQRPVRDAARVVERADRPISGLYRPIPAYSSETPARRPRRL